MGALRLGGLAAVAGGGAVVTLVWTVFERTQRPTLEIKSYVHSVHEAAQGWVEHTGSLMEALERMPVLAAEVERATAQYVDSLERG